MRPRGRRIAVDVHGRQVAALSALATAMTCMAVCIGAAIAAWSPWLVVGAGVAAVLGAVASVAAFPRTPPPRIIPLAVPPPGTWQRVEISGLNPGDTVQLQQVHPDTVEMPRVDPREQ